MIDGVAPTRGLNRTNKKGNGLRPSLQTSSQFRIVYVTPFRYARSLQIDRTLHRNKRTSPWRKSISKADSHLSAGCFEECNPLLSRLAFRLRDQRIIFNFLARKQELAYIFLCFLHRHCLAQYSTLSINHQYVLLCVSGVCLPRFNPLL